MSPGAPLPTPHPLLRSLSLPAQVARATEALAVNEKRVSAVRDHATRLEEALQKAEGACALCALPNHACMHVYACATASHKREDGVCFMRLGSVRSLGVECARSTHVVRMSCVMVVRRPQAFRTAQHAFLFGPKV